MSRPVLNRSPVRKFERNVLIVVEDGYMDWGRHFEDGPLAGVWRFVYRPTC